VKSHGIRCALWTARNPQLYIGLMALAICGLIVIPARAEWVWGGADGWVNMKQAPATSAQGRYAYGRALYIRGDYATASDVFQDIEKDFAKSPYALKARFHRGRCEGRLGNFDMALEINQGLIKSKPKTIPQETLYEQQIELITRVGRRTPPKATGMIPALLTHAQTAAQRYNGRMLEGRLLLQSKKYDASVRAFAKAAKIAPDKARRHEAHFRAGLGDMIACRDDGHKAERLTRATDNFREARSTAPDDERAESIQLYLWVIENLTKDTVVEHRHVYYAVTYIPERRYALARRIFGRAAKKYRGSRVGETARFFDAECVRKQGNLWSAYKAYELFAKEYPASGRLHSVVDREFTIATKLREAGKTGYAIIVYGSVEAHIPSGPLADDALMGIGHCNMKTGAYDEARATFDAVIRDYEQSEWYYSAVFYAGKADILESDFRNDSASILARARRSLERYLAVKPKGVHAKEAGKLIGVCKEKQAAIGLTVAAFYEKRKQPTAALAYYRQVERNYPESQSAEKARQWLKAHKKAGGAKP
jgi:outer membrane protein assembly factor BamD (BamD/ComL family)